MSERSDDLLLADIVECINKIYLYTEGMNLTDFLGDVKTQDAVSRNFEIIGEASARISQSIREAHPEIEWIKVKNFRNKIIHNYFGTDYKLVWSIKEYQLPELLTLIQKVISLLKNE